MSEAAELLPDQPKIYAHQPLDVNDTPFMLVTLTMHDMSEHPTPPIVHKFVMPYTSKSITWLEGLNGYGTSVNYEPIQVMGEPKAVHAILPGGPATTACLVHERRWAKYHQTLDQAFHRVGERPNCNTCRLAVKNTIWGHDWTEGTMQGAVLKQWSWDNVDEDFRPDGPQHHLNRPTR